MSDINYEKLVNVLIDELEERGYLQKQINKKSKTTDKTFPDTCEHLDKAEKLAKYLLQNIIEWKPDHKYASNSPSLRNWILDIERMIRLDGRKPGNIKKVIDYTFNQSTSQAQFWAKNIWSGKKLRQQYDRLVQDYSEESKNQPSDEEILDNNPMRRAQQNIDNIKNGVPQ